MHSTVTTILAFFTQHLLIHVKQSKFVVRETNSANNEVGTRRMVVFVFFPSYCVCTLTTAKEMLWLKLMARSDNL